ncbi:hypothetical protein NX059_002714 [Plenodomus lindquistii]|nr:hypothetical protein NX059_002714 [Plenodomus lindquistii]
MPIKTICETGAKGILQSLIAQLLFKDSGFSLDALENLMRLDTDHVPSLIAEFLYLVGLLPNEMSLIVVVDCITIYENCPSRRRDVELVLDGLVTMAEVYEPGFCIRKVLVTSPRGSRMAQKVLPKDDILIMPTNLPSRGGYTAAKWKASARFIDEADLGT